MALLLSACAVHSPPAINSSVSTLQSASAIKFPEADDRGGLRAQWQEALKTAFAAHSVMQQADAPFVAELALSVRDAETGLASTEQNTPEIDWRSSPRSNRLFDRCKAQRMRGTLVIYRRSDGAIVYRGESESDDCDFGADAFQAMADQLVSDAIG
ncbi:hypothetical protein [Pontixanthobacter aquaemixtae]|uniref:Uncharacterized protein n=1 Tax=Pontixanthobacter aquaemixtae TaxID=1958940 RepID=A0A844ZV04_9SPHN|nr:hypothetical protein [Pontixanthobacter aquaemixtae]MXO90980.1 hypothetical protein [Pontixanthobacter aquaemixtae]